VHTKWIRCLTGITVLSVAAAAAAADADKVAVAPATAEAAIEADTAHLMKLFELAKTKKKIEGRIKATALLIAAHAQGHLDGPNADRMAGLQAQALKVAEAAAKKDLAAAEAAAKDLAGAKGGDKKPVNLSKQAKIELVEVMDLYGGAIGGGMNIEKDIRDAKRNGPKDAKSAELIGARSAAMAAIYVDLLPELGGKKTKEEWVRLSNLAVKQSADVAAEGAKGEKADLAKLKKMLGQLDATCTNCHNTFRDE
jgi:hypothetical protein